MSFFSWWIWIEFGGFYLAFLQPALDPNSLCFFPVMFFRTPTSNLEGSILRHPGSTKNLYYGNSTGFFCSTWTGPESTDCVFWIREKFWFSSGEVTEWPISFQWRPETLWRKPLGGGAFLRYSLSRVHQSQHLSSSYLIQTVHQLWGLQVLQFVRCLACAGCDLCIETTSLMAIWGGANPILFSMNKMML